MTTATETDIELAEARNVLGNAALEAVDALFYAYDPDRTLEDHVIEDMVWQVENLLIDATFEIEDMVDEAFTGESPVIVDEGSVFEDRSVEDPGVATDDQGWELPGSNGFEDPSSDAEGDDVEGSA